MIKSALLVFTRAPIAGRTKTRLMPLLGAEGAAEFHQSVLHSTLASAKSANFSSIEIWIESEINHPFLQHCAEEFSCAIQTQRGDDLGEKMHHATQSALQTNDLVVLIGSDCPAINSTILDLARQQLLDGKDAVLGPSTDGGYYLIGLKQSNSDIFQDIQWSRPDVADKTRRNFDRLGLNYIELEELADIDTPEDYQRYINNH